LLTDVIANPPASQGTPAISIVVPTRGRVDYLRGCLASLIKQDAPFEYEVIVVADGADTETLELADRFGVKVVAHESRRAVNAARNSGVRAARAPVIAFLDDDVAVRSGWLQALSRGCDRYPIAEAFTGPIRPLLEGPTPRGCGRDAPLLTTLDLGEEDTPTAIAWGANLTIRRSAFERIGPFDETILLAAGDEEEWLSRLRAASGTVMYLAEAEVSHRRTQADLGLFRLAQGSFRRGIAARSFNERFGKPPTVRREVVVFAGCCWHALQTPCPRGLIMAAHAAGRLWQLSLHRRG
jgi:glycosyltransferase involved in cell wall biosynthesis